VVDGVVEGHGGGGEQGGHEGAAQQSVVEGAPQGRVGVEHGTPPTAGEGDRGRVDGLQQSEHGNPHLVGQVEFSRRYRPRFVVVHLFSSK
jgi:hypothetical protein